MRVNFNELPRYIIREIHKEPGTIKRGSSGRRVRQIQEWLCYHQCRTSIDGSYGPATAACVSRFQEEHSLSVSGRVTQATWDALVAPMRAALAEPDDLANLPREQTVARVAEQHLAVHPVEIGGSNRGPWVRLYCEGHDGPAWAWCAGFVSLILAQACFYRGEKTPIAGSVSCDSLAAQAKSTERFVHERSITRGRVDWDTFGGCCIFLRRRTSTDWVHAGFAFNATGHRSELAFRTIEGNTNDEGIREGFEACERTRSLVKSDYDFIDLTEA